MQEELQETQEKEVATVGNEEENGADATEVPQEEEKSFTQSQVNDIVRSRLDNDRARFFKRYGVKDRNELDNLVNKSQAYDVMSEKYEQNIGETKSLREEVAFLKNNIEPSRYDDVRAYFKGKDIEFTNDNLMAELETHPEWIRSTEKTNVTTIKSLSPEKQEQVQDNEKEIASKLFGFNKGFVK